MRTHFFLLLLAPMLVLAGCTLPGSNPTPTTATTTSTSTTSTSPATTSTPPVNVTPPVVPVSPSDYTVEVAGVPASVNANDTFSFKLFVNGTKTHPTEHVGAHFGYNSTNGTTIAPSKAFYDQACVHTSGTVPGNFTVTCTATMPGVAYLRGHMIVNDSGAAVNFWGDEQKVLVVGNYTMQTSLSTDPTTPNTAHLNTPYNFTLWINGAGNLTSDHIGAHYNSSAQTAAPSTAVYGQACVHQSGFVPGQYTVTCTFSDPTFGATAYLRAHMRLTDAAGKKYDFWSQEYPIIIAPI